MGAPRIFFICRNFGYPLGGVRTIYRHVRMLRANGFDAFVVLRTDEAQQFFEADVPTVPAASVRLNAADFVVMPEPWNDTFRAMARLPANRVVFCQNHYYLFHGLLDAPDWSHYGIRHVIASSEPIAAMIGEVVGLRDVPVVHYGIDHLLFQPRPKKRQIALMPRKQKVEALFIRECFRRRHPRLKDVPFVEIDMVPEARVAEILGESAVFLSLSRLEGFGMPPVEAMAAGCLVAGFHGGGGLEYARPENGLWCTAEDLVGAADALARAVDMADGREPGGEAMRLSGEATAGRYTLARAEAELLDVWRRILGG